MKAIKLIIDGQEVLVTQGSTVLEAIQKAGIYVPTLCHDPDLKPFGACRLCIVRIEGIRSLPTSCTTPAQDGMVVWTDTEEIQKVRRAIVEMAIANHPYDCLVCDKSQDCMLLAVARYLGVKKETVDRLRRGSMDRKVDTSNPAFDFDPNKCILCGICVRTCSEIQELGAIDFAYRGYQTQISPFGAKPLAQSPCVTCGECVERCPTGALTPKHVISPQNEVQTICPYCGVGCSIYLGVRGQKIVRVRGVKESPVNQGGLCVKGRYGLDFINHPDRLTHPLIRREGIPKSTILENPRQAFREAGWKEAMDRISSALSATLQNHGPNATGILSSAKCTNEDNYIIQKFARAVLGTNNVDHCARLCHASTVTAALAAFGSGAMSNSISDIDRADLLFVIGSNTTECHPIIGRKIKQAIRSNGTKLIVADPRTIELGEMAAVHLNHRPGTDVALLNGIMNQIVMDGRYDKKFVKERCEDFKPFRTALNDHPLERVEEITGVLSNKIRYAAELFEKAKRSVRIRIV